MSYGQGLPHQDSYYSLLEVPHELFAMGSATQTALPSCKKSIVKTLGIPSCHANAGALEILVGRSD
jgi:hypothetical protein